MLQQLTIPGTISGSIAKPHAGKVKTLAEADTPLYRVKADPHACTSTELLAAIIGGSLQLETAEALLAHFKGDLHRLYNAPVEEIATVRGLGAATATRIKAALAMSVRLITPAKWPVISSPSDAAALVQDMGLLEKEHLRVILLDTRNQVKDIVEVYKGSVNSSQVKVGEIFRPAIQQLASAIIMVHNHPSGEVTPSPDDVAVTRATVQAGNLLDITLLDHLILGLGKWSSLKEKGLGF